MWSKNKVAPLAQGQRPEWSVLPEHIIVGIEQQIGAPIHSVKSIAGGFSPGIAALVIGENGNRVFIKAASTVPNPTTPGFHRREILVNRLFPGDANLPIPRLRWSMDEGPDGWVVMLFDAIDGQELAMPWRDHELDRVIEALDRLAEQLTPSPIGAAEVGLASDWSLLRTNFWRLRDSDADRDRLDSWTQRNLPKLVDLSDKSTEAAKGDSLIHCDLRADNLLLTDDGMVVVDWPHARIGAAWIDPLGMAPSVRMQGGGDPNDFLMRCASAQNADPADIDAVLAAVAGYFTSSALEPEAPGLPGLRDFQRAQGDVARQWLAARTGWE